MEQQSVSQVEKVRKRHHGTVSRFKVYSFKVKDTTALVTFRK